MRETDIAAFIDRAFIDRVEADIAAFVDRLDPPVHERRANADVDGRQLDQLQALVAPNAVGIQVTADGFRAMSYDGEISVHGATLADVVDELIREHLEAAFGR